MNIDFGPKFVEFAAHYPAIKAYKYAASISPFCESPIEVVMGAAILLHFEEIGHPIPWFSNDDDTAHIAEPHLIIQKTINNYRVDFLLCAPERNTYLIVECDGKDFHHKNHAQIKADRDRDRALEKDGFEIMRVPGTQIYNESISVAIDISSIIAPDELEHYAEFVKSIEWDDIMEGVFR